MIPRHNKSILNKLLEKGDRRTVEGVKSVILQISKDKSRLSELIELLDVTEPATLMRVFDALEKITRPPGYKLSPKQIQKIFSMGLVSTQQEVLWHWCQIIPRLKLDKEKIKIAFDKMNSLRGSKSKIVWTFALQGMYDLSRLNPSLALQTKIAIHEDFKNAPASVKARCKKLRKMLRN